MLSNLYNPNHKLPLVARIAPLKVETIPAFSFYMRGTSSAYSKRGNKKRIWGFEGRALPSGRSFVPEYSVPAYCVLPAEVSVQSWALRFEATANAAVERALDHSRLLGRGLYESQMPSGLPVVVIGVERACEVGLGKKPERYRDGMDIVLVNGTPAPIGYITFLASRRVGPNGFERTYRIQITREEMEQVFLDAMRLFGKCAIEPWRVIRAYPSVKREIEKAQKAGSLTKEGMGIPGITFDSSSWRTDSAIGTIFGYQLPEAIPETGWHALHGFTYVVGELVKGILIPKIYKVLGMEQKKE